MNQPSQVGFNSGDVVDYIFQRHYQDRNKRTHMDIRLGTPTLGLYSWAVPKGRVPGRGERLLAKQTSLHDYAKTMGIPGVISTKKGPNSVETDATGKAHIVKAGPGKVSFEITYNDEPIRLTLVRSKKRPDDWILLGAKHVTPDEHAQAPDQRAAMRS